MRHRFFKFFFFGFFALLLIGGLRNASYRNAYYRGFQAGQFSAERSAPPLNDGAPNNDGVPNPESAPVHPGYGVDRHYRGNGFGFFNFLFMLLIFGFFFKVMRRMMWGRRGQRHWKHHYRGRGPKGYGPFNEYDGRSAKERQHDQQADDDTLYEM